jgi:hypothetical protein
MLTVGELRKVEPKQQQPNHLALIRQGVKLRKVAPMKQAPAPKQAEVVDPASLTIGDILQKLAAVREAVASGSSGGGSSSSSSSAW